MTAQVGNDNTPPDAPLILDPLTNTTFTNNTFTVSGTAENDSLVKLYYLLEGNPTFIGSVRADVVNGSWFVSITVPEGNQTIEATATDISSNVSDYSTPVLVHIKLPKPVSLPQISMADHFTSIVDEPLAIVAEVSGGNGPYHYVLQFGDGLQATGDTGGSLSISHRYLAPGSYKGILTITDSDGVRATQSTVIYIAAPGAAPISPTTPPPTIAPTETGLPSILHLPGEVTGHPTWPLIAVLIGLALPLLTAIENGGVRKILLPLISVTQGIWYWFLGLFKHSAKQFWGVIYDTLTKEPIPRVKITLLSAAPYNRKSYSAVTDHHGRFGFPITEGKWKVEVDKEGYRFPSELNLGSQDGKFNSVCMDKEIELGDEPHFNLPLEPVGERSHLGPSYIHSTWKRLLGLSSLVLLGVGILAEQIALLTRPTILDTALLVSLSLLFLLNVASLVWDHRSLVPVGKVLGQAGKPVQGVSVVLSRDGVRLERRVTDHAGRFFFRVRPGLYTISVERSDEAVPPMDIHMTQEGFLTPILSSAKKPSKTKIGATS